MSNKSEHTLFLGGPLHMTCHEVPLHDSSVEVVAESPSAPYVRTLRKLPTGEVRVVPGDRVFHPEDTVGRGNLVVAGEEGSCGPENGGWFVDVPTGIGVDNFVNRSRSVDIEDCFSTFKAAQEPPHA